MIQKIVIKIGVFLLLLYISWGCSSEEMLKDVLYIESCSEEDSIGRLNAVKKARQMTDLMFTPHREIEYNNGFFITGRSYNGLIYSSVKELENFVGSNVSFYTFMTAINNPRSKIYTERTNVLPYHGINCKAFYGTVCSELVSYALGIMNPSISTFDYPDSELMELLETTNPENLKIADVLWKKGHVAIITNVVKGDDGIVNKIEISEAVSPCSKRYFVTRQEFLKTVMSKFQRIYRYKEIGKNTEYAPVNNFVAVVDEEQLPFEYNNVLCVDKGDKANYLEREDVVINILSERGGVMEVYKDNNLFLRKDIKGLSDYLLENLSWGNYKARIIIKEHVETDSDFTYWKVVNADVQYDKDNSRLYFQSLNAVPDYVICCNINGSHVPLSKGFYHVFSEEEISRGYINVPYNLLSSSYPYLKVSFKTEYGRIIQKPIKWME